MNHVLSYLSINSLQGERNDKVVFDLRDTVCFFL